MAGVLGTALGLRGMVLLLPVGLVVAVLLFKMKVLRHESPLTASAPHHTANKRLLGLLATITALRSVSVQTAVTFLPLYFIVKGESLLVATAIASIWLGFGVLGQVTGGYISDRSGKRPVIASSLIGGSILFYGFLATHGILSLLLLAYEPT